MRIAFFGLIALAAAAASANSFVQRNDLFPPVIEHCHGSSIVALPNGDLLACWFQGSGERTADDVRVNGARLAAGASEWSPVFLMADTPGFPDCNPVLYLDAKERLWLFWITVQAHRWECSLLKYRYADDWRGPGAPKWAWQDVMSLKPGAGFPAQIDAGFDALGLDEGMWGEYAPPYRRMVAEAAQDPYKRQTGWMTRIHPLALSSGRLLLPLYSDGFNVSLVAISDDGGGTWRASAPIVGLGPIQPTLVQRKDGTVVAYLRDSGGEPNRVMQSESPDGGERWSPAVDTEIPNPGSSLEAICLQDGRWLMIANVTERGRHQLSALVSEDEGRTWPVSREIEPGGGDGTSFAYPSVIQTKDGQIHMTYSLKRKNGATIRHTAIAPDWLD